VVRFAGYAIDVPANWPVYRLDRDPARCVRYDRHAIYLGEPGGDPLCPAHLVGRVATISLETAGPGGTAGPAGRGGTAGPQPAGPLWGPVLPGLSLDHPQLGGVLLQDSQDHQLWGTYGHRGLTLTATYGTDQGLVGSIIRTLRWLGPPGAAATPTSAAYTDRVARGQTGTGPTGTGQAAAPARAVLARASRQDAPAAASRRRHARQVMRGFDTCATHPCRR
jgi:hypothetical protein